MNAAFLHVKRGQSLPMPESPLHRQIVALWRVAGRRDVLLVHIPNELADTDAKRFAQAGLGLWPGAPDLVFFGPASEPLRFLELKASGRYVTRKGAQADAREWIESAGHLWAFANNFDDAHARLVEWGLMRFTDARRAPKPLKQEALSL